MFSWAKVEFKKIILHCRDPKLLDTKVISFFLNLRGIFFKLKTVFLGLTVLFIESRISYRKLVLDRVKGVCLLLLPLVSLYVYDK